MCKRNEITKVNRRRGKVHSLHKSQCTPTKCTCRNPVLQHPKDSLYFVFFLSCCLTLFCSRLRCFDRFQVTVKIKCCTAIKPLLFHRIFILLPWYTTYTLVFSAHRSFVSFSAFVIVLWMGSIFVFLLPKKEKNFRCVSFIFFFCLTSRTNSSCIHI